MNTVFDQQGDLISRRALIEALKERLLGQPSQNVQAKRILHDQVAMAIETVEAAPVVDAEPVRHGRWMIKHYNFTFCEYEMVPYDATRMDNPSGTLYCSECNAEALLNGYEEDVPSRYCPNCGAKMGGGDHP